MPTTRSEAGSEPTGTAVSCWIADSRSCKPGIRRRAGCSTTTHWIFALPLPEPDLALNGHGHGLINSLLVPSNLSDYYAPAGRHLVTVNLTGIESDPDLVEPRLRKELVHWFGSDVQRWERLAVYRLPAALPVQAPPVPYPGERKVMVSQGLWVCGELGGAPSIQWALHSGTRAGESVSGALLGR